MDFISFPFHFLLSLLDVVFDFAFGNFKDSLCVCVSILFLIDRKVRKSSFKLENKRTLRMFQSNTLVDASAPETKDKTERKKRALRTEMYSSREKRKDSLASKYFCVENSQKREEI